MGLGPQLQLAKAHVDPSGLCPGRWLVPAGRGEVEAPRALSEGKVEGQKKI